MKDIRKFANDLADLIDENDYLKERVAELELKLAESEARFYGKSELAENFLIGIWKIFRVGLLQVLAVCQIFQLDILKILTDFQRKIQSLFLLV